MELEDALATLNVAADCSVEDAEQAHAAKLAQLEVSAVSTRGQDERKEALDTALQLVRSALAEGSNDVWTLVVPPPSEPEADDQCNRKCRIQNGKGEDSESLTDSDELHMIDWILADQPFSGSHEFQERKKAGEDYDGAA